MRAKWNRFIRGWPKAMLRQWPLLLVLVCGAVGLGFIVAMHWRRGAMMLGGATGLAGLLRLVLSDDMAGLLVVRSKLWDTAVTGLTGLAILGLALIVPPSS